MDTTPASSLARVVAALDGAIARGAARNAAVALDAQQQQREQWHREEAGLRLSR